MPRFSERIGQITPRSAIQFESMDAPLRSAIWNAIDLSLFDGLPANWISGYWQWGLIRTIWIHFHRRPADEVRAYWPELRTTLRAWFFEAAWYEVYDFAEFLVKNVTSPHKDGLAKAITAALQRELSGYRLVVGEFAPLTSEEEIAALESALQVTSRLGGVNGHLRAALAMLSDRQTPDYRNSIKESISAVESLCRVITEDERATLGQALKRLADRGLQVHPALEKAWGSLYGYTSDEEGIRHAMMEESGLTLADAAYFLVSCSAFITYLISLSRSAGLTIK